MSLRFRVLHMLMLVHWVASATLLRSILYDRWITVLASVLLLVGAAAARRGKAWGIGVALGAAAAFPMAHVLGMAPAWFWGVGAVGALPFVLTSKAFSRFDAKATAFGASLAVATGLLGALGWRVFGPAIVSALPALRPGYWPAHGAVAALVAIALFLIGRAGERAAAGVLAQDEADDALVHAPPLPSLRAPSPAVRVLDAPTAPGAVDLADADADDVLTDDALPPPAAGGRRA